MGKSFKGFSKALSLILAVAMVVTCVPTSAYAADLLAGESEDLLISNDTVAEEASDALIDASASEDNSSTSIDTQKASAPLDDPDENTAGEEDFGPDGSYQDVTGGLIATSADTSDSTHYKKHDNFEVFSVVGQDVAKVADANYTTITTDPTAVADTFKFDSVNGVQFWVVPNTGYEITAANLADAIKVEGEYKAKKSDDASAAIAITDAAYTVEPASQYPKSAYLTSAGSDFTRAYVVTLTGNSDFLKAYKVAEKKAGASADDPVVTKLLKVTVNDAKFTARQVGFALSGVAHPIVDQKVTFTDTYAKTFDLSAAFDAADWAKKTVTVAFMKDGKAVEDGTLEMATAADDDAMKKTDTSGEITYFMTTGHVLTLSNLTIAELFDDDSEFAGTTLTVTFSDKTKDESIHVISSGDLVEFKGLTQAADGATEKNDTDKYSKDITATAASNLDATKGIMYPFSAKVVGTNATTGRVIDKVYYAIGDADPEEAAALDVVNDEYGNSTTHYNYKGQAGTTFSTQTTLTPAADGAFWAIPAAAINDTAEGKTITLSATTKELVTLELSQTEAHKSYVSFTDGSKTVAVDDSITAAQTSTVVTGKDYKFTAKAADNRVISDVTAKMTQPGGAGGGLVDVVAGDGGTFTVSNVTGKLTVYIETEPVKASDTMDVVLSENLSGTGEVEDIATGDKITKTSKGKAYKGKTFNFKVTPDAAKVITKVTYVMAGGAETELTKDTTKSTIAGECYYSIPSVSGDITINVTEVASAAIAKTKNTDATVTFTDAVLGSKEIEDNKSAKVEAGKAFSFNVAVASGVTLEGVYFVQAASAPADPADKGVKLEAVGNTYKLGASVVKAGNPIWITVVTSREADAGYTVDFTSAQRPDDKTTPANKITSLDLKAGGTVATSAGDDESKVTVVAAVKDKSGASVTTGTHSWALKDDNEAAAVATFTPANDATTVIKSSKVSGANTAVYKQIIGFPQGLSYQAELPIVTTPMNTLYKDLKFTLTATVSDTAITTDALEASKMIRLDSTGIADTMTYVVNAKTLGFSGKESAAADIAAAKIGDAQNITSIKWDVAPTFEPTLKTPPYKRTPASASTSDDDLKVENATKAQTLTITANITFADDTTATVTDTLEAVDEELGYVAVPFVTQNGTAVPAATALLETKTGGVNNATVSWKVYDMITTPADGNWWKTAAGIKYAEETEKSIEEVTSGITWDNAVVDKNKDSEYATVSGTSSVSVTAKKATTAAIEITPKASVDGVPVMTPAAVKVTIKNELKLYTINVTTKDAAQITLATEYTEGFGYPKMTSGLAAMTPISWVAESTSKATENEIYEGFILTEVPEGTIIALPSQSAFDGTTIDKKKVLYGWKVTPSGGTAKYYSADGTATIALAKNTTIEALWAYRYSSNGTTADGQVELFKKVGDADYNNMTAALTVAQGKSVTAVIGYAPIDLTKSPDASGDPVYGAMVYGEDAKGTLTLTKAVETAQPVKVEGNVITGYATGGTEVINVKYVDELGNEFSTFDSGKLNKATDGMINPAITAQTQSALTYTAELTEFTGLEVGQTKTLPMTVKQGDTAKTKRTDFVSTEWTITPETAKDVVDIEWVEGTASAANSLSKGIKITGKKPGTANVSFKAVDSVGNEAVIDSFAVTVEAGATLALSASNAVTTTPATIAEGAELPMLINDATNKIAFGFVEKDGSKPATSKSDWAVTISTADTVGVLDGEDADAWSTGTYPTITSLTDDLSYTFSAASAAPDQLGIATLTAKYTTDATSGKEVYYTREVKIRSFAAVKVLGPKDATEAESYEVDKGTTAIETAKFETIIVPYVDGKNQSTDKFSASLAGFSAKQVGTPTTKYEFKGWKKGASAIVTSGVPDVLKDAAYELVNTDWTTNAADGFVSFRAVFGLESATLSGLPTEIVLTDETLTTKAKVAGTDRIFVQIGVTPKDASGTISVEATDKNKVFFAKDVDTYPTNGPGYLPADEATWDGDAVNLAKGTTSSSRTDKFTLAKATDAAATKSRNYVGTTTLTVKVDGKEYATIPVYINGEFKDGTVFRYMERGAVLENGSRTVEGAIHYYKDSALVTDGVVDAEGGKILIVSSAQVTTVGDVMYNGEHYYVGADGFLKTGGKFTGEGASDKNATYYADENGVLAMNKFVELDGALYFFSADAPAGHMLIGTGDKFSTLTVAEEGNWKGTFDYVVGTDGKVLTNTTIKIGEVTWFVNSYGQKIAYDNKDIAEKGTDESGKKYGKYTDPVTKQKWVIYEDGNAKMDDILYAPTVTWTTEWPKEYVKGNPYPTMKYKVNYTSKNQGTKLISDEFTATVTSDPTSIPTDAEKVTFTATADLSAYWTTVDMKEKATATKENKGINENKYTFKKGGSTGTKGGDYNYDDDAEEDGTFTAVFAESGEDTLNLAYTGAKLTPEVIVSNGDKTLVKDVDYTISYKDNQKAKAVSGKDATVTIKGKNNYSDSVILNFTIDQKDISDTDVTVAGLSVDKNAKSLTPVVSYKGTVLKEGAKRDYTVSETDGTVTITGVNNFTGTTTATITKVEKKALDPISKVEVSKSVAWKYTGEEHELQASDLVVTSKGKKTLKEDEYVISYSDTVNAGKCAVTVTAVGGTEDNFSGSKTVKVTIAPAATATITVENADALTTTGTKFKATGAMPYVELSAKDGDTDLPQPVYGRDYKVTYSNNKNAGQGKAKITFQGNFKGIKAMEQAFTINKPDTSDVTVKVSDFVIGKDLKSKKYLAVPDKTLFVEYEGQQIKKGDYVVTYKQGETVLTGKGSEVITLDSDGTATIDVEILPSEKAKNLQGTTPATASYKVVPAGSATDVTKAKVTIIEVGGTKAAKIGYTGKEITFDDSTDENRQGKIQVKIGSGKSAKILTDTEVTDAFDVSYVNNINKGTGYVILTPKDDTYVGTAIGKFTIKAGAIKIKK